jgi:hypothetical protein
MTTALFEHPAHHRESIEYVDEDSIAGIEEEGKPGGAN